MSELDIGEVARRSGLPVSTLRFYEEKGLIRSIGRRGLRRVFDPEVIQRLTLIALGREAGFTLAEIGSMFPPGKGPRIDRDLLSAKATEIDRTIRRLTSMRNGLRHAAKCPESSHLECPSFQRILRIVEQRQSTRSAGRRRPASPGP